LNWNCDSEITIFTKDSLFTITKTFETGYKFVEVKFRLNGEYELQNQENRKVYFSEKDTTFLEFNFNKK
jgi:hypothetical protein